MLTKEGTCEGTILAIGAFQSLRIGKDAKRTILTHPPCERTRQKGAVLRRKRSPCGVDDMSKPLRVVPSNLRAFVSDGLQRAES